MGLLVIFATLAIIVFLWWLRTLLTLLSVGPTANPEGWLAAVVIVTVLGPLGVLIYQRMRPDLRPRLHTR